jgi:hypothetical protein
MLIVAMEVLLTVSMTLTLLLTVLATYSLSLAVSKATGPLKPEPAIVSIIAFVAPFITLMPLAAVLPL